MLDKTHLISGGVTFVSLVATCVLLFTTRSKSPETTPPAEVPPLPTLTLPASAQPAAEPVNVPTPTPVTPTPVTPAYPLFATNVEATYNTIYLTFSTHQSIHLTPGENLLITPKIKNLKITHSWWDDRMELKGDILPETDYTIIIKKGTRSANKDHVLLADKVLKVKTSPPTPSVEFNTYRGQMALTPETVLPCEYLACEEITLDVWKAFPNNLIHYGQSTWHDYLLEKCNSYTYKVPLNKKQTQHALLPIHSIVKGEPGVYRFVLSTPKSSRTDECYIILSNIGATYTYDKNNAAIVAVQSLVDGRPIQGATVNLYDYKNQVIASGISDESGLAMTEPTELALKRSEPSMPKRMIITAGNDLTLIDCNERSTQHTAYLPEGERRPTFPTALWPNRDGIHPGESVQIYGLIRDANLVAANAMPLTLKLQTPDRQTLHTEQVESNADGYFTASFTIPKGVKSGYYSVLAKMKQETLAETDLYVSDFTPNHVRLNLAFQDDQYNALALTASTYFGSPVTKGQGSYSIKAEYAALPREWKEWSIGTKEQQQTLIGKSFTKDSEEATQTLKGVTLEQLTTFNAPLKLSATVSFSEPNSRAVTTSTTLNVTPHKAYLAMQFDFETRAVRFRQFFPEGCEPTEGTINSFTLNRRICKYVLRQDKDGWDREWVTYEETIPLTGDQALLDTSDIILTTETVERVIQTFEPGYYTLTAKLNNAVTTSLSFWHDATWVGKTLENPSNLVFQTDKSRYLPGETAQLTFEAPVDGRVIVVCGDTELQHAFTTDVTTGPVTLPVPIATATLHGSWTIGVTLIANNLNQESRYFGVAELPLDHDSKRLTLDLDLPQVATPQESITLTLNVTDHTGAPCRGTVALFAVDEAVLNVTGFETPDPFPVFFNRKGSTFTFGDIYGSLLPQLRLMADGRIGGDQLKRIRRSLDESIDVSEATTVITLPLQEVDETGKLTVPLQLPDFKGTLRFMAVVANERCIGATDCEIVVRPPATLTSAGVRYGCASDQTEFTFRVINHDLPAGPYTLTVGDQTITGEIATGGTRYHTLTLPSKTYDATLQIGDFTTTTTHNVTLLEEVPIRIVTLINVLTDGETLPEQAEPLGDLESVRQVALAWLADYPYCCTEQLSSRLLPYTTSTIPEEQACVRDLFTLLASRLTSFGAFSLWSDSAYISPEASLLATQVLIESTNAGILDKRDIQPILTYLYTYANSQKANERDLAAHATFLLGEVGLGEIACHAARNLLITRKTDTAAFVAAATLVFNGAADEGAPIMKAYLAANPIPPKFHNCYMDEAARQGMVLELAIRAGVCSDDEINTRLNYLLRTPWEIPQANTWVARALKSCSQLPHCGQLYRQYVPTKIIRDDAPIKVRKTLVDRNGTPVTTLNHGDLAFVDIEIHLPHASHDLILRDRLPGGLEYEDANLATRESAKLPESLTKNRVFLHRLSQENLGAELRFFGYAYDDPVVHHVYPVRATAKGTFAIPAAIVEDMYDATYTGGHDPIETLTIQ